MSAGREGHAPDRPHLLLVGGGHAHIQVFHDWLREPPDARVTLLVDRPEALYSGMVPGFVAGQYSQDELSFDLASWAARIGAELVVDRAEGIDVEGRQVLRSGGAPLSFDVCSFNIGSTVHGLDVPGVRAHALSTRPIAVFVEQVVPALRDAIARRVGQRLHVLVVGGGAAGVELALCLQARARAEGAPDVAVSLVCASPELLPGSVNADGLRRRVEQEFQRRHIEAHCDEAVIEVRADEVALESGETLPADLVVWATGAAPHLPGHDSSQAADLGGWIPVGPTLQHVEHPDVFAVGDCARLVDHPSTPKAGVYAVRQGPVLAHNLRARLAGRDDLQGYEPQADFLTLLNLGDGRAVGAKWGFAFRGRWVLRLKDRIDRAFMTRFR